MIKNDLRANGYSEVTKYPNQSRVNILWAILALILMVGTFSGLLFFLNVILGGIDDAPDDVFLYFVESFGILGYMFLLIISLLVYLCLKLFMTILFCHKAGNARMTVYYGMPICFCTEALRAWQIVLINIVPFILTYSLYIFLCIFYQGKFMFMLIFFFMLFFLAFDLTAAIYVLFCKVKNRVDYISLDRHIYEVTLYKRQAVRFTKKKKIK